MSRTSVQTLPNVMLEKGVFDDLKVFDLLEAYGCVGFTVWISLLFKIADDKGYYTQMSPSLIAAIQKDIGNKWVNRDKIIGVINGMLECELLDSSLFKQGVLTSVGIQRRYLDVKRKSRSKGFSTEKYWLLGETQADSPIEYEQGKIERNNADKCSNNADKCNNNSDIKITGRITGSVGVELSGGDYEELVSKLGKYNAEYYIERVKAFNKGKGINLPIKSTALQWYMQDKASEPQPQASDKVGYTGDELNEMFHKLKAEDL